VRCHVPRASPSRKGHDLVFVSRQLGHVNAALTWKVYARPFDAARHAAKARERLEADYGRAFSRRVA